MFGALYTRTKFWVITLLIFVIAMFPVAFMQAYGPGRDSQDLTGADVLGLIISLFLINTLANRIRDYGSNPWLALWSLLPLVGLFQALYFGIRHKKSEASASSKSSQQYTQSSSQNSPEEPELKRYSYQEEPLKEKAEKHPNGPSKPLKRLS